MRLGAHLPRTPGEDDGSYANFLKLYYSYMEVLRLLEVPICAAKRTGQFVSNYGPGRGPESIWYLARSNASFETPRIARQIFQNIIPGRVCSKRQDS